MGQGASRTKKVVEGGVKAAASASQGMKAGARSVPPSVGSTTARKRTLPPETATFKTEEAAQQISSARDMDFEKMSVDDVSTAEKLLVDEKTSREVDQYLESVSNATKAPPATHIRRPELPVDIKPEDVDIDEHGSFADVVKKLHVTSSSHGNDPNAMQAGFREGADSRALRRKRGLEAAKMHDKQASADRRDNPEAPSAFDRLSAKELRGMLALHQHDADKFSAPVLSKRYSISEALFGKIVASVGLPEAPPQQQQ